MQNIRIVGVYLNVLLIDSSRKLSPHIFLWNQVQQKKKHVVISEVPSKNAVSVKLSTTVVESCMYMTVFDMVDTAFSYGRVLIVC